MSPLEPERAAEARRAVVASKVKRVKLKLSFCGLIAREVEDKFSRKKLNLNFPQLSKKLYLVEVKKQLMVIVVPPGERKEKLFEGRETE